MQYVATSLLGDFGIDSLAVATAMMRIVKFLVAFMGNAQRGKEQPERVVELMVRALETAAICIESKLDGMSTDVASCKQLFKDTVVGFLEQVQGVMKTGSGQFVMSKGALRLVGALAYLNEGCTASVLAVSVLEHAGLLHPFPSTAQESHHSLLVQFGSIAASTSSGRRATILALGEMGPRGRECHVRLALVVCALEIQHQARRKTSTREGVLAVLAYTSFVLRLDHAFQSCSTAVLTEFTQVVSSSIQRAVKWMKQQQQQGLDGTIVDILADLRARLRAVANANKEQQGRAKPTSFRLVLLRLVSSISDALSLHETHIADLESDWDKRTLCSTGDTVRQDSSTVVSGQGETYGEYLEPSDSDESDFSFE